MTYYTSQNTDYQYIALSFISHQFINKMDRTNSIPYTAAQTWSLAVLRILIGWHLLYEGVVKLWNPGWSAGGYLMDSQGYFAEFFYALAANPKLLEVIDFLNIWGLMLIGLALLLGAFTRVALVGGIALLGLYFLSHPPLIGVKYALPSEGSYLLVNKNLIEIAAMVVLLVFPASRAIGLDRFFMKRKKTLGTSNGVPVSKEEKIVV
ncbi:MAG: DoxX family membrane protein [Bacteroidota bacterium]